MKVYRIERNGIGMFKGLSKKEALVISRRDAVGRNHFAKSNEMKKHCHSHREDVLKQIFNDNLSCFEHKEDFEKHFSKWFLDFIFSFGFEMYEYECEILTNVEYLHPWIDTSKPFSKRKI